jgi:hypothetical protein
VICFFLSPFSPLILLAWLPPSICEPLICIWFLAMLRLFSSWVLSTSSYFAWLGDYSSMVRHPISCISNFKEKIFFTLFYLASGVLSCWPLFTRLASSIIESMCTSVTSYLEITTEAVFVAFLSVADWLLVLFEFGGTLLGLRID